MQEVAASLKHVLKVKLKLWQTLQLQQSTTKHSSVSKGDSSNFGFPSVMKDMGSRYPPMFSSYLQEERKGSVWPHAPFSCRRQRSLHIQALQDFCHKIITTTQLPTVVQHTQSFAPTPWRGRECLCTAQARAATPLETTFKRKHKPRLWGCGSALAPSHPAAGVTQKQPWSHHNPPGSTTPLCLWATVQRDR